jgi:3-oxoacyl-[acyl-carrier-protein] synthase-3
VTALAGVATYLPDRRVPIEDLAGPLGLTRMQVAVFRRYHGLAEVRRDDGTVADLLMAAVARLGPLRGREHQVRYVLHARSMPVVAPFPFNPVHEVCQRAGLGHAIALTVTHHACATGLLALDTAGRLLAEDADEAGLALVLAGEKAFTRDAQLAPETSFFGEASAACLVQPGGGPDRLLSYVCRVRGEFDGRLEDNPEMMGRYQREYSDSLAEVIGEAADRAGTSLAEIGVILPHNVNRVSWQRLAKEIGFPAKRVLLDNVPVTGHAFCADAFLNYRTAAERGLLRRGDRYLIAAAGAGATFSAMVLEH